MFVHSTSTLVLEWLLFEILLPWPNKIMIVQKLLYDEDWVCQTSTIFKNLELIFLHPAVSANIV